MHDAPARPGWVRRNWGGWPRALFVVVFVIFSSAGSAGGQSGSETPWITAIVTVLSVLAGISILFNPVAPDKSSIASLALISIASLVLSTSSSALVPASLLTFYVIYEISAYCSTSVRRLLGVWLFLGSALAIIADDSMIDTYSGHAPMRFGLDTSEFMTLLTFIFAIIVVWILVTIPWLVGRFMRGRRRPIAG